MRKIQNPTYYLLFAFIIGIFYINTLGNSFIHDDVWQVEENENIKNISYVFGAFTSCLAGEIREDCQGVGAYYRPIQQVVYTFVYQFSGNAWVFHLTNLILIFVTSILVYNLGNLFFKNQLYSALVTIVFIAHPINSEVANWVSAQPEILLAIFFLTTYLFYVQYSKTQNKNYLLLSLASTVLMLFSKETGLFLLIFIPIYDCANRRIKVGIWSLYLLPVLLYLAARNAVLGKLVYEQESFYSMTLPEQIINGIYLYPKYIFKLIYPLPLSLQHLVEPLETFKPVGVLGITFIITTLCLFFFISKKNFKTEWVSLWLIALPLLGPLLFVDKIGENLLSERYLFISSIGFSLLMVNLAKKFLEKQRSKTLQTTLLIILGIYITISWMIVFNRNSDWKNHETSYKSILKVYPNHAPAHYFLGKTYQLEGNTELAIREFKKALEINPEFERARQDLQVFANHYSGEFISFFYPNNWQVEQKDDLIQMTKVQGGLAVIIKQEQLDISLEEYFAQRQQYGVLINQGLAKIPISEKSFLNIWNNQGVQYLQFFLFKSNIAIEIVVWPGDSPFLSEFEKMLASLVIKD